MVSLTKREADRKLANVIQDLEFMRAPSKGLHDEVGDYSSMLSLRLIAAAVYSWLANEDVVAFKSHLKRSTDLLAGLFARAAAGDNIPRSRVEGQVDRLLLHSWAADVNRTKDDVGGAWDLFLIGEEAHPSRLALSRALVAVLENRDGAEGTVVELRSACTRPARNYLGYATVLHGVLARNQQAVNRGVEELLVGHAKECRPGGELAYDPERYLYVSVIGIAKFAQARGLTVTPRPPLVPCELLR